MLGRFVMASSVLCPGSLFLLCLIHAVFSDLACPGKFQFVGKVCYYQVPKPVTWLKARDYCESLGQGASLATILNRQDEENIMWYLRQESLGRSQRFMSRHWFHWIAGTDRYRTGDWIWDKPNSRLPMDKSATFWKYDEPSVKRGCLVVQAGLSGFEHKWQSYPCYKDRPFVCEMRLYE